MEADIAEDCVRRGQEAARYSQAARGWNALIYSYCTCADLQRRPAERTKQTASQRRSLLMLGAAINAKR